VFANHIYLPQERFQACIFQMVAVEEINKQTKSISTWDTRKKSPGVHSVFEIGKTIGRGTFTEVRHCKSRLSGEELAVKVVNKQCFQQMRGIENEVQILQMVSHPNIIQLKEVYEEEDRMYIIMELLTGGELYTELEKCGPFSEEKTYRIFVQILEGVKYLHSIGIVHRDLKLENILFNDIENTKVKLTDFGLSKSIALSPTAFMRTQCGTPTYVAPEVVEGVGYTQAVDLWSLGVILYLLLSCQYPFIGESLAEIHRKIVESEFEWPSDVVLSSEVKDLISHLLKTKPEERYNFDQIISHSWTSTHKKRFELQESERQPLQ